MPSQCLCFSGLSASRSSVRMTALGFGTVRLLLKNILYRQANYDHSSDKGIASRQAGVQINCCLGSEDALGFPAQRAFPVNVGHALVSFSYGIVVLLARIWKCGCLESRSSGGGHRSRLRTFRTPPAVEAYVQFDDPSGEQIDGFLNSKSPLVVCAPHDVVIMHTPRVRRIASGRLSARPPVRTDSTLGLSL